jgi:DNA-binding NarL/FixJ family response regulator
LAYREDSDRETGEDLALHELIRLVSKYQDIARSLLEQAEAKCREILPSNPPEDECGWNFTDREEQVAELLVEGLSNRRIARALGISERTVKNHLHSIFNKLDVSDRTQAVIKLMRPCGIPRPRPSSPPRPDPGRT